MVFGLPGLADGGHRFRYHVHDLVSVTFEHSQLQQRGVVPAVRLTRFHAASHAVGDHWQVLPPLIGRLAQLHQLDGVYAGEGLAGNLGGLLRSVAGVSEDRVQQARRPPPGVPRATMILGLLTNILVLVILSITDLFR